MEQQVEGSPTPVLLQSLSEKIKIYSVKYITKAVISFAANYDSDCDDQIVQDALLLVEKKRKRGWRHSLLCNLLFNFHLYEGKRSSLVTAFCF